MRRWQCATAWAAGGACLALGAALVVFSWRNQRLERTLQQQQAALQSGILGPQGQQVGNDVLRDLAAAAQNHAPLRELLARHGYQAPAAGHPAPAAAASTGETP